VYSQSAQVGNKAAFGDKWRLHTGIMAIQSTDPKPKIMRGILIRLKQSTSEPRQNATPSLRKKAARLAGALPRTQKQWRYRW
jgi:hypothetical protein